MRITPILCFFVLAVACSKSNDQENPIDQENTNKAGIEYPQLMGGWHPEQTPDGQSISFAANGELIYKQWDTLLTYQYNRFRIDNDSTLTFIAPDLSTKIVGFRVEGTVLYLNGACITNCTERLDKLLPL